MYFGTVFAFIKNGSFALILFYFDLIFNKVH